MRLGDDALRRLGWALTAFFFCALALDLGVTFQDPQHYSDWGSGGLGGLVFFVMIALFPVVAQLIVRQLPRNRIGWLLHVIGVAWAMSNLVDAYGLTALVIRPGSLPGGDIAEVISSASWVPGILLMGVAVLLLFPDGRPAGRRWRLVGRLAVPAGALVVAGIVFAPGPVTDMRVPLAQNPLGIEALAPSIGLLQGVTLASFPLLIIASAISMIVKFRRAEGVRRLQLRWLMAAGASIAAISSVALTAGASSSGPTPSWEILLQTLDLASFGLIPVAIGIAITRHGLYGLDALISRALTVAVLGAFVTAVYVGIVVGLGTLVGRRDTSVALSVLATALVAVAFQPVRARVQHAVNRLVYGERATPYEVLADFATRMTGRYTTGELLPRLAQTVSEALGGAAVTVWLHTGRGLTRGGAWPQETGAELELPEHDGDPLGVIDADRVVPVRHRDELLGAIAVTKRAHEPFAPAEATMLEHVASQAGQVLRNLRLVEDLRSSRRRLVTSQDDERRRLERDLHDGAQQSLVSVKILLGLAAQQPDPEGLAGSIEAAATLLRTAVDELRELAHGIHPAILTERGLPAAVQSVAGRSATWTGGCRHRSRPPCTSSSPRPWPTSASTPGPTGPRSPSGTTATPSPSPCGTTAPAAPTSPQAPDCSA